MVRPLGASSQLAQDVMAFDGMFNENEDIVIPESTWRWKQFPALCLVVIPLICFPLIDGSLADVAFSVIMAALLLGLIDQVFVRDIHDRELRICTQGIEIPALIRGRWLIKWDDIQAIRTHGSLQTKEYTVPKGIAVILTQAATDKRIKASLVGRFLHLLHLPIHWPYSRIGVIGFDINAQELLQLLEKRKAAHFESG
jgi:hypothetical protein